MDDTAAQTTAMLSLRARTIPAPASISPEAQAMLSQPRAKTTYPEVGDAGAWRAWRAGVEEQFAPMLLAAGQAPGLEIHTGRLGGVTVYEAVPAEVSAALRNSVLLEIHGGAMVIMGGEFCRMTGAGVAARMGLRTVSVDYRMPPEHPYPAALDDCIAVYRALLETYAAGQIAVTGSSAGGNLAAALALRARDEGLPSPAALVLQSPEADLTESGDSFQTNLGVDPRLTGSLMPANLLYADGHDLRHPYLSPLFGTFDGSFPPTLLTTGTRDLFLSNTVRLHRVLRRAGIVADLHVFEAMPHGGFMGAPEDAEMHQEIRRFVHEQLSGA